MAGAHYRLTVSLTSRDLADAHAAATWMDSGLRPLVRVPRPLLRVPLVVLGLLWASGPLWLIAYPERARWSIGGAALWLAGCWVAWQHLLQPWLERRRIARGGATDEFILDADESRIVLTRAGASAPPWRWAVVARACRTRRGILMTTWGGDVLWLPARCFENRLQMRAFDALIRARIQRHHQGDDAIVDDDTGPAPME